MSEDEDIPQYQTNKFPKFLIITYIILPIWGIYWFVSYWNGSTGFLDRGYWHQLQVAAGTTFDKPPKEKPEEKPTKDLTQKFSID